MWYRFHEIRYTESRLMLVKSEFKVISNTPKGVWIDYYGQKKFVKTDAKKRFACPTVEEALESYHARKKRQVKILKRQLRQAEAALTLTKEHETAWYI